MSHIVLKPTVSILYYLLGNLRSRWCAIGKNLGVSDSTLEAIKKDHKLCDRRMIEMLECWCLNCRDCTWSAVVKALEMIGEEQLSRKVDHYTKERQRIESALPYDCCKRLVPLKCYCYDDQCLQEIYGDLDTVIGDTDKRGIVECLLDAATKWYQIGISVHIRKRHLDAIEEDNQDAEMKLALMVDRLVKMAHCKWRMLIQALIDMDLCGLALSIQCLAQEKVDYTEIPANFSFREFRRKDFISQNETREITNDKRYQQCLKAVRNILNIPSDVEVLGYLHFKGPKISAQDCTSPSNKPIYVDEKVIKIIDISNENSEELEEHAKELAEDMRAALTARATLQKQKGQLKLNKNMLEDELKIITEVIASLHTVDNLSKQQVMELEMKKHFVELQLSDMYQALDDCTQKLSIENAKFTSINKKLNQFHANLDKCKTILRSCNKYADIVDAAFCDHVPSKSNYYPVEREAMLLGWPGQGIRGIMSQSPEEFTTYPIELASRERWQISPAEDYTSRSPTESLQSPVEGSPNASLPSICHWPKLGLLPAKDYTSPLPVEWLLSEEKWTEQSYTPPASTQYSEQSYHPFLSPLPRVSPESRYLDEILKRSTIGIKETERRMKDIQTMLASSSHH